jgi:hypothetical protein
MGGLRHPRTHGRAGPDGPSLQPRPRRSSGYVSSRGTAGFPNCTSGGLPDTVMWLAMRSFSTSSSWRGANGRAIHSWGVDAGDSAVRARSCARVAKWARQRIRMMPWPSLSSRPYGEPTMLWTPTPTSSRPGGAASGERHASPASPGCADHPRMTRAAGRTRRVGVGRSRHRVGERAEGRRAAARLRVGRRGPERRRATRPARVCSPTTRTTCAQRCTCASGSRARGRTSGGSAGLMRSRADAIEGGGPGGSPCRCSVPGCGVMGHVQEAQSCGGQALRKGGDGRTTSGHDHARHDLPATAQPRCRAAEERHLLQGTCRTGSVARAERQASLGRPRPASTSSAASTSAHNVPMSCIVSTSFARVSSSASVQTT